MIGEPRVLLFDAIAPDMLLLARLVWHPEDVPAAASLIDETKLQPHVRALFTVLTAEDRDDDIRALRVRVRIEHQGLFAGLDYACTVPAALYELVSIGDLADAIAQPRRRTDDAPARELGARYPALARWRDQVLSKKWRCSPLERAAAWELSALEADNSNDYVQARLARQAARSIVVRAQKRAAGRGAA